MRLRFRNHSVVNGGGYPAYLAHQLRTLQWLINCAKAFPTPETLTMEVAVGRLVCHGAERVACELPY